MGSGGISVSGTLSSSTVGPYFSASGWQRGQVELVELGGVAGQQPLQLGGVGVVEQRPQVLAGERLGALVVGVVAAPHELVEPDLVAGGGVGGPGLADAHPHVLVEVLGGRLLQHVLVAVADLARGAGAADAVEHPVEALEQRRHPGAPALGDHELQAGEPLEDARQDELHQGPLRVEGHLVDVEQHRHRVRAVVGHARAAVHVDRQPQLLDLGPEAVVDRVVQRLHPGDVGRDVGQQDAAAQAVLLDEAHVLEGVVDVVEEDLPDAGAALGELAAPVDEPAVVGPDAGQPVVVLVGLGRLGEEDEAGEERRDGVGEDDLAHDAVGLLLAVAHLVVPVAVAAGVAQVAEGVLVLAAPGVEVVEVPGVEVLAVLLVAAPRVTVGRDDRVVLGGRSGHRVPLLGRRRCHGGRAQCM